MTQRIKIPLSEQHYLSRDALAPWWKGSKKINKFWIWLKLAKTIRFGFIVLFYIWEPWDVCWFSSDFHKMSIANHLLTKWNWMLWLVTDLRKTSGSSIFHLYIMTGPGTAAIWIRFSMCYLCYVRTRCTYISICSMNLCK